MGLDEYLRKFTSDDNASFQQIHDKDREKFQLKIQWMYRESEKYRTLNQLAITQDPRAANQTIVVGDSKEVRTIPSIAMCDHEPQANLFFKETDENLERLQEQLEAQRQLDFVSSKNANPRQTVKSNTRIPTHYRLQQLADEENAEHAVRQPRPNPFGFTVPLTREEILADDQRRAQQAERDSLSLNTLLSKKQGLWRAAPACGQTPVINGYKMLKGTPIVERDDDALT